jgi:hypothetical protein
MISSPRCSLPWIGSERTLAMLFALIGLWGSDPAQAATSAVAGFYHVDVPQGNSAWTCGLVCADLYTGPAVTVTADLDGKALVTFASPDWTGGEFTRHYAEPQSGTSQGLAIDVLSNTADTLKLDATPAEAGLTDGMVFILRKHATLAGLMPNGGGFVPFNDSIGLIGLSGTQQIYFWNNGSSTWIDSTNGDASNVIIRPGQGFVIQVGVAKTLTLGLGEVCFVKTTPTKIRAANGVPNLIGALNPLSSSMTLAGLGVTSDMAAFNDSIVTLDPGSLAQTGTFLSDGTNLINSTNFANSNNVALPAGTSIVINVDASKNINLPPVSVGP